MLGLAEQVSGDPVRIGGGIGDDEDFRRPGNRVDADPAEDLALGFGDPGVAGADNLVDRRQRACAERHGADGLRAADGVILVHAGLEGGVSDGVGELALRRRGDHHDALHAGNPCRDDIHQHGRGIACPPAGDVDADRVQRRPAPAEFDAGIVREAMIGGALGAVIGGDPVMREIDGRAQVRRAGRGEFVQVHIVGFEGRGVDLQAVILGRIVGHRCPAALFHVSQDVLDHVEHVIPLPAIFREEARQDLIKLRLGGVKVAGHGAGISGA